MNGKHKELTAYCGLYCGDCIRYKSKASDLAADLASELRTVFFEQYAKVKGNYVKDFGYYNKFSRVLYAISKLKCDISCRLGGNGCRQSCKIKKCAQSKILEGCWECDEFKTCDKLEFLEPFHGESPRENLRKIKKYGLDGWAEHREKCYPWL